jgi:succinate dehydrogenase / fumarate reductase, flavoprotein subunit
MAAPRVLSTSVLVIGSGGAGLRAAIELRQQGVAVLALAKRRQHDAHTVLAAGGINAVLGTMDPDDTWQQHAADTIAEAYFLADPAVVETVVRNAPRAIDELVGWGLPFAREDDGRLSQRYFGAHTYRRTCFAGDYTGLEIQRALLRRAAEVGVPIVDTLYVSRLLAADNQVFGAYGFDIVDGSRVIVHADAVILATGGHTRIWRQSSSRRDENTGDSFRLAALAGARIRDAELVQFHPSGLLEPAESAGQLVSEAARGEGGILLNARGERFMARYDPERMELSTRDRVALAIYTEIREGRGTPGGGVLLDLTHLDREVILTRLPRIYRSLLDLQMLDVTKAPIEIAPTAHYSMGGVSARAEDHATDVRGLFVAGEAASGMHGANRLGGNSLAELLVYGRIAGAAAAAYSRGLTAQVRDPRAVAEASGEADDLLAGRGFEHVRRLQRELRDLMTEHAGVVRSDEGLAAGLATLDALEARLPDLAVHPDIASYDDLAHAFDLKGSILAARATLESARARRETRGAHNRSDHPALDPALQVNMIWSLHHGLTEQRVPDVPPEIAALIDERRTHSPGGLVE